MSQPILRWIGRAALALPFLLLCYGLAAAGLSRIAINRDFQEDLTGIPVAIVDNGVHVDIITSVAAVGHDWRRILPVGNIPEGTEWLGFGWGAKEFYLSTPTWADLKPWNAAKALFGIGGTTMRVHFREQLLEAPNVTVIRISVTQFRMLAETITASMALGDARRGVRIDHPGYGRDLFLEAHGRYSPILTCNEWASRALAKAGIGTAFWSPLPNGVAPLALSASGG